MAQVVFRGATKSFDKVTAVDHLDLEARDGELLVLLGPSGCGKTTALRLVAGLEDADSGEIVIGDRVVNDVDAKDRDVAMVFQSYALYPHLTVRRNIEFPLRQRGVDAAERRRRAADAAETLGLTPSLDRKPRQLSGGQRQRVALARAVVREPRAFLMDEPLSNLDAALRLQTRADIVALQHELGTTMLYVTHDQVEAMTMGHRIAVMQAGKLQQVDEPQVVYDRPANVFVARFVGSPGMNVVPVLAVHDEGAAREGTVLADVPGGTVVVPRAALAAARGESLLVGVRAEDLQLSAEGTIDATVLIAELLGADVHVLCRLPDDTKMVVRQGAGAPRPANGEPVRIAVSPGSVHVFTGQRGDRLGTSA